MNNVAMFTIVSITCTWVLAPRCFRYADSLEARRRLHGSRTKPPRQQTPTHTLPSPPVSNTDSSRLLSLSTLTDSLARASRSGMPSVETALSDLHAHHPDDVLCRELLMSTVVNGAFVSSALDHVSSVLRDMAACRSDVAVAASQARLSARMLTSMPFGALVLALVFSNHFRSHLLTLPVLIPLVIGLILNRMGWAWIIRLINSALTQQASELSKLTDHLCVSLRAGHTLTIACEQWEHCSPSGAEVAHQLQTGQSLHQSLQVLDCNLGAGGAVLAGVVLEAHHDGLPVITTVARLSADARAQRRRESDVLIRQLPTKLSLPLVLCVLPSFLFAAVVPLAMSNLARLAITTPIPSPIQP